MRAPGRTPEDVLTRTRTRRAAIAASAALLLVTSASATTAAPHPAVAATTAAPATFTFALPATFTTAREEHAASRAARVARPRHASRARPTVRRTARVVHHADRHRTAQRRTTVRAVPGSGRLGVVYAFARRQIGDPYVFGGARPGAWDCSGLTKAAYARIGVELPHRAAEQAHRGVAIPRSRARVGDLVVWGGHHVGLYAGHGRVLHAPRTGKRVQIAPIWGAPTFRRVTRG